MNIYKVDETYAVSAQIVPGDVAAIAAHGFVAIICHRPDGEEAGQPSAAVIEAECVRAGLLFHHIPFAGMPIADDAVQEQRRVLKNSAGPVLGYCRSGQRSTFIWQASA